jgi:hypothetical protein
VAIARIQNDEQADTADLGPPLALDLHLHQVNQCVKLSGLRWWRDERARGEQVLEGTPLPLGGQHLEVVVQNAPEPGGLVLMAAPNLAIAARVSGAITRLPSCARMVGVMIFPATRRPIAANWSSVVPGFTVMSP